MLHLPKGRSVGGGKEGEEDREILEKRKQNTKLCRSKPLGCLIPNEVTFCSYYSQCFLYLSTLTIPTELDG